MNSRVLILYTFNLKNIETQINNPPNCWLHNLWNVMYNQHIYRFRFRKTAKMLLLFRRSVHHSSSSPAQYQKKHGISGAKSLSEVCRYFFPRADNDDTQKPQSGGNGVAGS